jgi:hypothetical protein
MNFRGYRVVEELDRIAHQRGKPLSILVDKGPKFAVQLLDQRASARSNSTSPAPESRTKPGPKSG